ncbi:uncharacterized protein LY79DRAFT_583889 [Colletotrichum navitas]|uniref:O-methyltransferase n=1 Tax=Colletotrichum navitas TaxID=681940 RepID=A0AAD8V0A9_9PEZI|nr:uncharacterized protein LY79DRAFT_583889 [Colletotrichum navitas]KAK1573060.1 hypothetical protein LY79DRAFT_583889 [Colletotrichum navitas]
MASNSRIIDLARSVTEHPAVVDDYLQENGLSELVAHTLTSALLVRLPPVKDLVAYGVLDMLPAGMRLGDALQRFPGSLDPKDTGAALANLNCDHAFVDAVAEDGDVAIALLRRKTLWQIHSQEPKVVSRFHAAMAHESTIENTLLDEFFGEIRTEGQTMVDIGGGRGAIAVQAARRALAAPFIVQDLGENCEK